MIINMVISVYTFEVRKGNTMNTIKNFSFSLIQMNICPEFVKPWPPSRRGPLAALR